MRNIGLILVVLGFLAGSYLAVERPSGLSIGPFLGTLLLGAIGIALLRIEAHRSARQGDRLASNLGALERALEAILGELAVLNQGRDEIDVYDLRHEIDQRLPPHLDAFVSARESIAVSFGLQAYADVMNPFAAGERSINRVWSASTDGYIDEAHTYLQKAVDRFREADEVFRALEDSPTPPV